MSEAQNRGIATSWSDTLDLSGAMFEYFFLGLRKLKGVSLKDFERVFPFTAHQVYAEQIRTLTEHDLLLLYGDMLRLSPRGLMVADSVIERFAKPEIPPTKLTELPKPEERQR
jgi:oxygen-independent coproporphyrinogen-3 oxidase